MLEINGLDKDLTERVLNVFCEILGITLPSMQICIDETITQNGICYHSDGEFMILLRPRELGHMFVTLAHEMTHVKQYLKDNLEGVFDDSIPYKQRWWEVEAFRMETILTKILLSKIEEGLL